MTSLDLIGIQRLILGLDDPSHIQSNVYPTKKSADDLEVITTNVAFETIYTYAPLEMARPETDFYAIKLGDVNGSCNFITGTLQSPIQAEEKNSVHPVVVNLNLPQQKIAFGEEVLVPVTVSGYTRHSVLSLGLQVTPEFSIIGLESGVIEVNDRENYVVSTDGFSVSLLTLFSDYDQTLSPKEGGAEAIFYIHLRANQDGFLHESVIEQSKDFENSFTALEGKDVSTHPLSLMFNSAERGQTNVLGSVAPNPFVNAFAVNWETTEFGPASLQLSNLLGQTILTRTFAVSGNGVVIDDQLLSRLTPGAYVLRIALPSGDVITQTVIKK